MAKVVGLSCTHRPVDSLTDRYLQAAIAGVLAESPSTEIVILKLIEFDLRLCVGGDECLRTGTCPLPDQFYDIIRRADSADGLLLCLPVYGGNVPAILKIFMERLKTFMKAEQRPFGGIPVATIVHSRAMLIEAAIGAISPWLQRLGNKSVATVGLTRIDAISEPDGYQFEICEIVGRQLAVALTGAKQTSLKEGRGRAEY